MAARAHPPLSTSSPYLEGLRYAEPMDCTISIGNGGTVGLGGDSGVGGGDLAGLGVLVTPPFLCDLACGEIDLRGGEVDLRGGETDLRGGEANLG